MKLKFLAKTLATALIVCGSAIALNAQNGTLTPYSRYGYGILRDNATSAQRSMGGIGYAMNSGRQINVMNPASYARIDSLTFLFDMGLDLTNVWMEENGAKESHIGGGLDYINMQFPLGRYMGASVGVLPYASTGYSFGNKIDNGSDAREGGGSINMLYLGIAGRPFKGFSIGANISYLFGTVYNDTYAYTVTGSTSLLERQIEVRDYHLEFGAQYNFSIARNTFTLGLTYAPGKKLLGNYREFFYDPSVDSAPEEESTSLSHRYSLAESWGAGINWRWNNQLMLEADFTYQPWSKAKFPGYDLSDTNIEHALADRYKIAFGGEFIPAPRGSYFKRVHYRAGAFWNRDYLKVMNNNLREYGASIGFGLPVPGFKTMVNLGLEWSHRQAYPNPLIKENYIFVTLGINFNEMWFRQNKLY